jgi:hypothetical protein
MGWRQTTALHPPMAGHAKEKEPPFALGGSKVAAWNDPTASVYRRYLVCGHTG